MNVFARNAHRILDELNRNPEAGCTCGCLLILGVMVLGYVLFWGTIIGIVGHFIHKFW